MKKIEEALWQNYNDATDELKLWEVGTEEYNTVSEERDKLRNELIKLGQIEEEKNIKIAQIESEDKREKIRNAITIGTFVIGTCVSLYLTDKTFKFDKVATVTSTLGRNILNGVVPKILRK